MTKRHVAILIPYRKRSGGEYEYFLQYGNSKIREGKEYRFWGGRIEEGETPEQAMVREIEEELAYKASNYQYLDTTDTDIIKADHFYQEVSQNFEKEIKILEGDFGKFFTNKEAQALGELGPEKETIQKLENTLKA